MQQWIGRLWREWRDASRAHAALRADHLRADHLDSHFVPESAAAPALDEQADDPHLGYLG